jgi:hypothetical protein
MNHPEAAIGSPPQVVWFQSLVRIGSCSYLLEAGGRSNKAFASVPNYQKLQLFAQRPCVPGVRDMNILKLVVLVATANLFAGDALAHPGSGISTDKKGNVFFLDTGSGVWKIDTAGHLTHLAGPRYHWMALDEDNRYAKTRMPSGSDGDIVKLGSNPTVLVSSDYPIAIGQDGNFYYPTPTSGTVRIMRIFPSGASSVFATLPRSVSGGRIEWINGLTVGPNNSLYYSEDNAIRRIDSNGIVSLVARDFGAPATPPIPGIEASSGPYLRGLFVNSDGVIYVAASGSARVIKLSPSGTKTPLAQTSAPWSPTAVTAYGSNVYSVEFTHDNGDDRTVWMPRVRKIAPDGNSSIVASVDTMPGARTGKRLTKLSQHTLRATSSQARPQAHFLLEPIFEELSWSLSRVRSRLPYLTQSVATR